MSTYTLYDFLKYPNMGFKLTLMIPFDWLKDADKRPKGVLFKHRLHAIWFLCTTISLIYQNVGQLIYYFMVHPAADDVEANTLGELSQLISLIAYQVVALCKIAALYKNRARITALMQELLLMFPSAAAQRKQQAEAAASFGAVGYRTQHFATTSGQLMKCAGFYLAFLMIYYSLLPVAQLFYELAAPDLHPTYEYQTKTWYPWQNFEEEQNSPVGFVLAYVCQIIWAFSSMSFLIGNEFLLCFFITQIRMHFDYLARALAALDARSPGANSQLKQLIQYHSRLLRLCDEINSIFNPAFVMNLTTSSAAICLTSLTIVTMSVVEALIYFSGLSITVLVTFFFCYNGHLLTKSGNELMPAAVYSNWYEGDLAYRRMILFFVMRTRDPYTLRVYKFSTVSMETFMAILKLSYQLFTFFRAMD